MDILRVLEHYVQPALGCTEPAAVALAAAAAREAVGGPPTRVDVVTDRFIFRNGLAVGVPGAGAHRGNAIAAALGAVGGNSSSGLEVLSEITSDHRAQAETLLASGAVTVQPDMQHSGPFVLVTVHTPSGMGRAMIEGSHSNIVYVEANGQPVEQGATASPTSDEHTDASVSEWIRSASVGELIESVEAMNRACVEFVLGGISMNRLASQEGLRSAPGLGGGTHLARREGRTDDLCSTVQATCAGAIDARMAGLPTPVMTSAGSGNQGVVITIPVWVLAQRRGVGEERLAQAAALGHLLLARMSEELGLLSPLCGSAVQAAAAVSGALTWLLGGDAAQVERAASATLGTQASVVCDGAKGSCALKAAGGAEAAVRMATLTMDGMEVGPGNGLVGSTLQQTTRDVAQIAQGMDAVSERVIDIITRNAC